MNRQIMEYLTPMLGEATAANMLKHYCVRMKIAPEDIQASHMPDLAVAMRPMLAVWLGSAGAEQVSIELARLGRKAAGK